MNNVIKIDNEEYEVVPDEARILTEHLFTVQERLGVPDTITNSELNTTAWSFIIQIFNAWRVAFPQEFNEWFTGLQDDLKYERPIRQAVKGGGYIPISYPYRFYRLMKIFLPNIRMNDKHFTKKMLTNIPEMRNTNYKL